MTEAPKDPTNSVRVYLGQEVLDDPATKVGAFIELGGTTWKVLAIDGREVLLQWKPDGDDGGDRVVTHLFANRRQRRAAKRKAA